MEGKMKGNMGMMMCFMLVVLMGVSSPLYAADVEVEKEEFDQAWKEAYESLPPEAREEFQKLTIDAFKEGEVGYVKDGVERAPVRDEGLGEGPGGIRDLGAPIGEVGAPYPLGPMPRSAYDGGPGYDDDKALEEMGLGAEDIKKIRNAEKEIEIEASQIEWDKLSPEDAKAKELEFEKQFEAMVGQSPRDIFVDGPPIGDEHFGPPPPGFEGPYMEGPHFGPGPMEGPHFEGPYMEGPYLEGPGFEGPKFEGPYMEGPHFEGPMMEGPMFEGPMMEGPMFEGPMMEGPEFEGPMFEGPMMEGPEFEAPMFEGPEFEAPEFVRPELEPEFVDKEEPELYHE